MCKWRHILATLVDGDPQCSRDIVPVRAGMPPDVTPR
jgi:hypothetical protein